MAAKVSVGHSTGNYTVVCSPSRRTHSAAFRIMNTRPPPDHTQTRERERERERERVGERERERVGNNIYTEADDTRHDSLSSVCSVSFSLSLFLSLSSSLSFSLSLSFSHSLFPSLSLFLSFSHSLSLLLWYSWSHTVLSSVCCTLVHVVFLLCLFLLCLSLEVSDCLLLLSVPLAGPLVCMPLTPFI